jgi:small neutral amino acid transporter SnatA (MarC family)
MPSSSAFTFKQANRRYRYAFWPAIGFYVIACFAGPMLLKAMTDPPKWIAGVVAVVTAAPIAIVFWLMGRWLKETDEYTRATHIDAMLVGGGILFSLSIGWGFLELFDVAPHLPTFWVAPGFFFFYGATRCVQRLLGSKAGGE